MSFSRHFRALLCIAFLAPLTHAAEVPWESAMRDDSADWADTVKQQAEAMNQSQARLIFIGDSITESWDADVWKQRIAPAKALNFGVGGEGPQHVLWRMEHGILDGPAPETVVLMIGINNFWRHFTASDTARGIEAIVARIHTRHPITRIVLLGLLPVYEAASPIRPWIAEINGRLGQLKNVEYHDFSAAFLEADGNQRLQLYQEDHLHLTKAGYIMLARELTPVLNLP